MSTYPALSPRVIGQAEKTLNAILDRLLAGTGLTEPQWVILTLAVTDGGPAEPDKFTRMVADALKISETEARARVGDMVPASCCRSPGRPRRYGHRRRAPAARPDQRRDRPNHPAAVGRPARRGPGHRGPDAGHHHRAVNAELAR